MGILVSWVKTHFHDPLFHTRTSVWRSMTANGLPGHESHVSIEPYSRIPEFKALAVVRKQVLDALRIVVADGRGELLIGRESTAMVGFSAAWPVAALAVVNTGTDAMTAAATVRAATVAFTS
ncbi:MAG: hypothetical protein ACREV7_07510 [Steroidobacteraceae bacterium]